MASVLIGAMPASAGAVSWRASYSSHYVSPYDEKCSPCSGNPGVLTSVVALNATHALAAGWAYPGADADSYPIPVIKAWNGARWMTWSHQPKTTQAHTYRIVGLAAASMSSVWVVTSDSGYPYAVAGIRHWDGHRWSTLTTTGLPQDWSGQVVLVRGVPNVVGADLDGGGAFVARYGSGPNGHRWYATHVTRVGGLQAVAATSGVAFAAGGADLVTGAGRPQIFEHTKSGWHATQVTAGARGAVTAIGVAGKRDALAVGRSTRAFALRWNGHRWSIIAAPPSTVTVQAVVPDGTGGYWAAGRPAAGQTHTIYLHYVGRTWRTVSGPDRANAKWSTHQYVEIQAMARTPNGGRLWAVGAHLPNGEECDDIDGCADETAGSLIIDERS